MKMNKLGVNLHPTKYRQMKINLKKTNNFKNRLFPPNLFPQNQEALNVVYKWLYMPDSNSIDIKCSLEKSITCSNLPLNIVNEKINL